MTNSRTNLNPVLCKYTGLTPSRTDPFKKLSLPNGSYITNHYDTMARMRFTRLNNSSHTTLNKAEYGYNAGNQRHTMTNSVNWSTNRYDAIGQLSVVDSSSNPEDRGYKYDTAWNLSYRTNNGALETFTVDGKNQVTSSPESSGYYYDDNGNPTYKELSADYIYVFDAENRLTAIEFSYGYLLSFSYDGLSRLRTMTTWVWMTEFEDYVMEGTVSYIYDGMRVIQERGYLNMPEVSYTRGTDLSGSLEGAGGIGGLLARSAHSGAYRTNHTHAFYHADGNGNVTYMQAMNQAMAASYRYDAYGNTVWGGGVLASANRYRFSSKMIEPNSGLYYYGYRWYVPSLQRWLNRDPLGEAGADIQQSRKMIFTEMPYAEVREGANLYFSLKNNPTGHIDPNGMPVIAIPAAGGGVFVALRICLANPACRAALIGIGTIAGVRSCPVTPPPNPCQQWTASPSVSSCMACCFFQFSIGQTTTPGDQGYERLDTCRASCRSSGGGAGPIPQ